MGYRNGVHFVALFGVALAACGSNASGDGGNTSGGASAGGVSGSSAETSAGTSGAAGSQPMTPSDLFPLAVGDVWNFTTTANPGMTLTTCKTGMVANTTTSSDMQLGRVAFENTTYCGAMTSLSLSDQGIDQLLSGQWVTILKSPVEEGAS